MFFSSNDSILVKYKTACKKCNNVCAVFLITVGFIVLMTILAIFATDLSQKVHIVYMYGQKPKFVTDEKFLSIALDTSIIASDFKHLQLRNEKLRKMMSALSPAYLRIGGTMADRLTFSTEETLHFKHVSGNHDGGSCSYEGKFCDYLQKPNFTMNAEEWLKLNRLAQNTSLDLIFDLNSLKRFDNGSWDYTNAEKLIDFSSHHNLNVNWELGNEPNAFRHQFDYEVAPSQMAKDFQTLESILRKSSKYAGSLLVGPDVTRPQTGNNESQIYLKEFLKGAGHVVDAVTWHQYYFNGATARFIAFLDPQNFDILQWQINVVKNIVKSTKTDKPIWLGETSSAYGGGARHLSNRFIATFLWLDKLGTSAKNGISVVIRQSIVQGHYALIDSDYNPTPNWWVSIVHKRLVGNQVVECHSPHSETLRLYCQCTKPERYYKGTPSVTVFGINISSRRAKIRFQGMIPHTDINEMKFLQVHAYILSTVDRIDSRYIYLNGEWLQLTQTDDVPKLLPKTVNAHPYVELPPYSLGFWVVPISNNNALSFC